MKLETKPYLEQKNNLPKEGRLQRRAIQLGLRHKAIAKYSQEWIIEIEDISNFVAEQRQYLFDSNYENLQVPVESIYPVVNETTASNLRLSNM